MLAGKAKEILTMMLSECSLAFEHLPILQDEEILRNILYAGVWNSYEESVKKDLEPFTEASEKAGEEAK